MSDEFRLEDEQLTPEKPLMAAPPPVYVPPTPRPVGRPDEYDKEKADQIIQEILTCTDGMRAICKRVGVPYSSYKNWRMRHPDFNAAYLTAKALQVEDLAEEIMEISDEDVDGDMAKANMRKLAVESRKWYAGKLAPKIFGNNTDTNINLNVKHSVETNDDFNRVMEAAKEKKLLEQAQQPSNENIEEAEILDDGDDE